jgi:hypothetical protein
MTEVPDPRDEPPECPDPPDSAELILRQRFFVAVPEKGAPYAMPELLLLGNREGFEWLSRYFANRAASLPTEYQVERGDPDDHWHLGGDCMPRSAPLSDEIEIRVGVYTEASRGRALAKYAIDTTPGERGCLRTRFRRWIRRARQGLRGRLPDGMGTLATTSWVFVPDEEA